MQARFNFATAAPDAYKAAAALDHDVEQQVEPRLMHLIKLRASRINGCAYCVDMHVKESRRDGLSEQWINLVCAWRESPVYDARERAVLAWTEALTNLPDTGAPDADFEPLRAHFSEAEIARITLAIGVINVWTGSPSASARSIRSTRRPRRRDFPYPRPNEERRRQYKFAFRPPHRHAIVARDMTEPLDPYIDLAQRLADVAGDIARRYFRTRVAVDDKDDRSPVTIADREAEAAMRALIAKAFPQHGIVGEEHGSERAGASHVWVLDPIDGTRAFITGRPLFGSLIALCRDGKPIVGVIDCPALRERWVGAAGRPTTYLGKPVRTRACERLDLAALSCTAPQIFDGDGFARFERVRQAARTTVYGGDCFAYGMVAAGFADLVIEAGLKVYDYAALVPVFEGAGGGICDWSGRPLDLSSGDRVLAYGDARAQQQALKLLA
jgi:histidinol phosphatase-like enzyme (inositol monophosphatase family)